MADDKKESATVTLLNRGKRHYDVIGPDGKQFRHAPGTTAVYGLEEADKVMGYSDLIDITKMPGQASVRQLKADNETLLKQKAELEAQLASLRAVAGSGAEEPSPVPERKRKEKVGSAS